MTKRILVVEDTEDNRRIVRDTLSGAGYDIIEASDGAAGVAMAAQHKPDLILMDIQLPGMDGLAATKKLKADPATRNIPILVVTSYAMKGDEAKAFEAGCSGYVTKPIDKTVFLEAVAKALRSREDSRGDLR